MRNVRLWFPGLAVGVILIALPVLLEVAFSGQAQGGAQALTPQHAILLAARAIDRSDLLLLASGGIVSGQLRTEEFPLELEGGEGLRTLSKSEIDTLDLGFAERPLDRVLLRSGEVLQGHLRLASLPVALPLEKGERELPLDAIRGVLLRLSSGKPRGNLTPIPKGGEVFPLVRRLLANPLADEIVSSLTRYDWFMLRDGRLLSGAVLQETIPFRSLSGELTPLDREAISLILFNWPPGQDMVVLRTTGAWVLGTVELPELQVRLADPLGEPGLAKGDLFGVFFRVTSLGGGGPSGP